MDPNGFLPPGVNPFVVPSRFPANQPDYPQLTGPQSNVYQPPLGDRGGAGDIQASPTSSNQSFTSPIDYPPITPPHLTHSRRGSRESGETSSSNSTPSSGAQGSSLVHRHKRSHASSTTSPVSPVTSRKSRKPKKKDTTVEDEDEDAAMSDEDPVVSQKLRKEDAKKSRQDAEQKRRDQLKNAYDLLRGAVPGTSEKTSKVTLVNHARLHIEKLQTEREKLRNGLSDTQQEIKGLRALNQRLMEKLMQHGIDFEEDLRATEMEIPPDDEPLPDQSALVHQQSVTPTAAAALQAGPPPPPSPMPGSMPAPQHRPTHIRTSSNASGHFQLQVPPAAGVPMSAPLYTTSLPPQHPQPPISTPSSPIKGTNYVPQPMPMNQGPPPPIAAPGAPPQLHLTFPGTIQVLPSPSSSASSSAPRHTIFSPDGGPTFYSDEHSSSDSGHRSSAASSHVNVNIAHMSLEEQQAYLRQQHGTSAPHSPSQGMAFSAPMYSAPYPQGEMQFGVPGHGDPGLGLQTLHGSQPMENGEYTYVVMPHDDGSMPTMPGAFPTEDNIQVYGHQAGYMHPGGHVIDYGGDHIGYAHPTVTLTHDGSIPTHYTHHIAPEAYINASPNPSKPPSPRMLGSQPPPPQFLTSPVSQPTPQPGINTQLLPMSTPSMAHLSPHQMEGPSHPHSPLPPPSPFHHPPHGGARPDTGLNPAMSDGGLSGPPDAASNEATPGPSDGTWTYNP